MITIIPAIDLIGEKCVRLTQGDYTQKKIYRDDPVEVAKEFEAAGITRLHLVDLDGAKAGKVSNLDVLKKIAKSTRLHIDFGGGVKTREEVEAVVDAGATFVSIGSIAVQQPQVFDEWVHAFGPDLFMVGADVRENKIAISGWQEQTDIEVMDFIRSMMNKRVLQIFCTDIAHDGVLKGPALELYLSILGWNPGLRLIASGGVSSMEDIHKLDEIDCYGVIVGKALYEGKISLKEIEMMNAK